MKKRVGDTKGKYLVGSMTERQKRITQLKASLHSLTIDDFILRAIDEYPAGVKMNQECNACGSEKIVLTKTHEYHADIADNDVTIKVFNYPYVTCSCNEWFDLHTEKYLEELLNFEILQRLKDTKKAPESIDMNDLMKM